MRFHLLTLGCPKNEVDSEMMGELLRRAGHHEVANARRADVLIVNTCAFVRDAREESYGALRELARQKRRGQRLVAAGCLAQRYAEAIYREVPEVDAVIGTQSWPRIAELVEALQERPAGIPLTAVEVGGNLVASVARRPRTGRTSYLKIADGCSASCAFCAIPLIKGPQRSKPREDILREAAEMVDRGVREIILIAQNTTSYGRDRGERDALAPLLEAIVDATPELVWLRTLYAYPQDVTPRLLETMARLPQACHYLDLPLQHGHPDVLRRMGRPHDVDAVRGLVARVRAAMPDVAVRTTFIVGFPGETEREFEALLDLMAELAFDKVGVFAYSREEGTPAAEMEGQLPAEVIAERYDRTMRHQQGISLARNREQVGRLLRVLVDGVGDGLSIGRSYRDAPEIDGMVLIPGELEEGEFVTVRIAAAQEYDLIAEPVDPAAHEAPDA